MKPEEILQRMKLIRAIIAPYLTELNDLTYKLVLHRWRDGY